MSPWRPSPEAEEEFFQDMCTRALLAVHHHFDWCATCDERTSRRCPQGQRIEDQYIVTQQNLRKVQQKNKRT